MFSLNQHPDDYIARLNEDRARAERQRQLLRALRGATPPFGETHATRLVAAMQEAARSRPAPRRKQRTTAHPCPDAPEAMTP
jgi:hypothetical protein